jgi:hypothetical protein
LFFLSESFLSNIRKITTFALFSGRGVAEGMGGEKSEENRSCSFSIGFVDDAICYTIKA